MQITLQRLILKIIDTLGNCKARRSFICDDLKLLRLTVRNSNHNKHEPFQNIDFIFDYDKWQSTKRNQYLGTGGALGDFLKRILGMGYASRNEGYDTTVVRNDDNSDFGSSKQWPEPLILRFNGQEYKYFYCC